MYNTINQVISTEIDSVMLLIKDAIKRMESEGNYQWDSAYPNRQIISDDVASSALYSIRLSGNLAGIVALNEKQSPEYQGVYWTDSLGYPLIIHRLCIHPQFQRQGLAKRLMLFAEGYARENGYSSIRLDAFSQNRKALSLYDALFYQRRGLVSFRGKGDFCCFEKLL